MTPELVYRLSMSPEAKELRAQREHARRDPRGREADPLAARARLVGYWKARDEGRSPVVPWCWAIYRNKVFRYLLMPQLRGRLDARDAAHQQAWRDELRRSAKEWEAKKAAKAAEKKAMAKVKDLI